MNSCLKPVSSLCHLSVSSVVDNFDRFLDYYSDKQTLIGDQYGPDFGPFRHIPSDILMFIIEELILRKKLNYNNLKLLLPVDATGMTCNEDIFYTPIDSNIIKLISFRCPNFEMFHCHKFLFDQREISDLNLILRMSIPRLFHLRVISLYDTWIENETLLVIARNCPHVEDLNLRRTNFTEQGLNYLLDDESLVKHSLNKFTIDEMDLSSRAISDCLFNLANLTYFLSDRTIDACWDKFKTLRYWQEDSFTIPSFNISVLKNKFCETISFNREFEDFIFQLFPNLKHLIFVSLSSIDFSFLHRTVQRNHITHLELSSSLDSDPFDSFEKLIPVLIICAHNLTTLKLENFEDVNLCTLGSMLVYLKKLTLTNNTYEVEKVEFVDWFSSLEEIEIVAFKHSTRKIYPEDYKDHLQVTRIAIGIILSKVNIKKVFIYEQLNFTSYLVLDLLQRGYLKNLREMNIYNCPVGVEAILGLFYYKVPVQKIEIGSCPNITESDITKISKYIKENNLSTSISVNKFPYRLRWITLDTNIPMPFYSDNFFNFN